MRKPILVLTITAFVLGGGAIAANAQAPDPHHPGSNVEQESTNPPIPGAPGMQQGNPRAGMMGGGMISPGMMGGGMTGSGMMARRGMGPGMMGPMMMRMMFALMDADGDGKISLQEFQAAHERIFKAIDANKDGFITLDEMQVFIRGAGVSAPQQ